VQLLGRALRYRVMRTSTIAAAALSCCVLASPAAAASTATQTLSRVHTALAGEDAQVLPSGAIIARWSWRDGPVQRAAFGTSFAIRPAGQHAFGAEHDLPSDLIGAPVALGDRRLLLLRQHDTRRSSRVHVDVSDLNGRVVRSQVIASRRHIRTSELAVNERGDAALAWYENFGSRKDRIYVSLRRRGGRFWPPILIARGPARAISVAIGPRGDVLAAWDARGRIRTRFKAASERAFRRLDQLRSAPAFSSQLKTAVAADGRAWIAWSAKFLTEGGTTGDAYVQAAMRNPGGGRFHRALLLEHAPPHAFPAPVSLALDERGAPIVAWAMSTDPLTTISSARIDAAGVPRPALVVSIPGIEPNTAQPDLTLQDDGTAVVIWGQPVNPLAGTHRVLAATQRPGEAWSAPQTLGDETTLSVTYPRSGGPPLILREAPQGDGVAVEALGTAAAG
jgi:hypothetical protein